MAVTLPDARQSSDEVLEALRLRALRACCEEGAIAVVTSHRPALRDAADRVVTLRDGTIADALPQAAALQAPLAPRIHLATA